MIRENRRSSKVSDGLLNGITYLSSLISVTAVSYTHLTLPTIA